MNTVIIIPARKGSTRFPGKPMAMILGKQLLFRTWLIAKAVQKVEQVYIATDDEQIRQLAEGFGAKVIMTPLECSNGTERVFHATQDFKIQKKPDIVLNLQGDAVLTPPWVIQSVVDAMLETPSLQIATPATRLNWEQFDAFMSSKSGGRASGTLVVFDRNHKALYFSKGTIPFVRDKTLSNPPIFRHIGLYAYRFSALDQYVRLKPTPLEEAEKLEQLRALENGIPIQIVEVDYRGRTHWSVDNPDDVEKVEEIIKREGELLL